ncbi:hypothetical protein SI65_06828 [Aspergillus cristatus]|uniref:Nudix hydrolase domain-containing protein n=1 Tax=Aspergillus cristatus TaxID=573508 RepID=A0A1E3BAN5_ASPCR|nr:hypothetical protein SI65_06828 [Aspergillus cristatus]
MQLEDWLDDLCVRFIINLPHEELESVERICFQVEEAQWFYEDFIRPLDPALPSLSLKAFALRIFQHCPLMSQWSHYHHITAFSEFLAYKTRVPVRGAIMLNEAMDEVVLVKGWKKGANWSFPRGKINKDEKDLDCAIREVYEETGFDVGEAGLVKDEKDVKFIEITMREQHMRLYVFRGVPRDAYFEPRTRKEISKIEWYKLSELPTLKKSKQHDQGFAVANANKFYMVAPFMHPLKKWIAHQKKIDAKNQVGHRAAELMGEAAQIASTITPVQAPVEMAAPSDLPEVAPSGDVSAHLKRLLNINHVPNQFSVQPSQEPAADPKSNALLELLRGGSSEEPAMHTPLNEQTVPLEALSQRFPLPDVFPDLPRQTQYAEQSASLPQTLPPLFPGMVPPHLQHAVNVPAANQTMSQRPLDHQFPPTTHIGPSTGFQDFPPFSAPQPPVPSYREEPLHIIPPQRPAAAPYQKTGDPQFSQQGQPPQIKGASVPPASKLPPPKLTSHSLALLNVFKTETPKTPQISSATMAPGAGQDSVQARKPSQHQDQLLNLLRGSPAPATSAPVPVELAADSTPPTRKQILQRPNQCSPNAGKGFNSEGQTSATVSGPLNMPQFEGIAKPAARRMQNGTNRKAHKDRQPQTQPLSSPITILARPQSAKRDQSSTPPPGSRTPSQSRTSKTKQAESQKPFQPQILRRSEKTGSLIDIPLRPKAAHEPDQREQGMGPPVHVDRRPSQTAAQRDALLSLFGKKSDASGSPSPGPVHIQTSAAKPSSSSAISPLSPSIAPSVGAPVSGRGTPAENGLETAASHRVSSPDNKAFLLGFLEGVAKGNK